MILEILGAYMVFKTIDLVEYLGKTLEDIADSIDTECDGDDEID